MRVAVLTVGQPRTVAHPIAAASFALFRSSLVLGGNNVTHLMWLVQGAPSHRPRSKRSKAQRLAMEWAQPLDERSRSWRLVLPLYTPTRLVITNETLTCRPQCRIRCDTLAHDAPIEWLRQFHAVASAWRSLMDFERSTGQFHDWYVKTRPDLVHLQPLPSLATFDRDSVYVPLGVMTSDHRYQRLNDHIFVCARKQQCDGYFRIVDRTYSVCGSHRAFRMPWPPQTLYARSYSAHELRTFPHAYTLARVGSGPTCFRLACNRTNSFSTGCVATHLPQWLHFCERLGGRWHNATLASAIRMLAVRRPSGSVLRVPVGGAGSRRPRRFIVR